MLVPGCWLWLFRSSDPIPMTSSMSSQPPAVVQRIIILGSSSKDNYHSLGCSRTAKWGRMVNSGTWNFTLAFDLHPGKWTFLIAQNPAVINWFLSCVSTKDDQIWFVVWKGMTIPSSWCLSYDIDRVPDTNSVSDIQMVEVIGSHSSWSCCSSVNYDFVILNLDSTMGCSWGRGCSWG